MARKRLLLRLQNRQTYLRILLYFVSISLGAMTISTFSIYTMFSRSASGEIGDHSVVLMKERAGIASSLLESTATYAINWSRNTDFETYALQNFNDAYRDNQIWMKLKDVLKYNPFIDSAYIVNGYTNLVLTSNYGLLPIEGFWDKEVLANIRATDKVYNVSFLPRQLAKFPIGHPAPKNLLSIIISYETNRSISSFVLNVDMKKLHSYIGNEFQSGGSANEIAFFDEHRQLVTSTNAQPLLQQLPVLSKPAEGWTNVDIGGDDYLLAYVDVPFQGIKGWTMTELIPKNKLFNHLHLLRNLTFVFYGIFFLALLITIWRLSRRIYSPLEELIADVKKNHASHSLTQEDSNQQTDNELSYLSQIFNRQKSQLGQLSNYWRENRLASKESVLRELLLHPAENQSNRILERLREQEISLNPGRLCAAIFRIDHYAAFCESNNTRSQRLIKYAMQNIVKEDLASLFVETAGMDDDHIAAVFNLEDDQEPADLLPQLDQIQAHFNQYLSLSSTVVISGICNSFNSLHSSYSNALERSNERFKSGRRRIFFLEAQSEAAADYIYPEEQERAVLAALRLGHQEECISHLEQFVKHLAPYSYSESRLALTHFMINLGKTVRQIRHDYSDPHLWSLTHIEMQLDSLETIDNVMEWLHSVIASVLETNQNAKSNRHSKLMHDIRTIVESNIGNVNLSSKFVADALGMSVPYLRPLFKEIMNQSLSDYITGLRLEEVKRQLVETNRTVEDISRNAGFSALNSFYAIFKKNYGITPAQYRKENQAMRDDRVTG